MKATRETENQGVGGSIPSLATIQIEQVRAARKLPVPVFEAGTSPAHMSRGNKAFKSV
jgi:hypothetical protein